MQKPLIKIVVSVFAYALAIRGSDLPTHLLIQPVGSALQLRLPRQPIAPVGGMRFRLNLETSSNLKQWANQGEIDDSNGGVPQRMIQLGSPHEFFRVRSEIEETGAAVDGADLFGYNRIFQEELNEIGFITPADFAAMSQPSAAYLEQVSFDPTTANYWEGFAADPAVINADLPAKSPDRRLYDFRLNDAELGVFKTNGFVVSERLGSYSYAEGFYRVLSCDLPVFVSSDAMLHAWHFSYERLLEESEETQLAPALQGILDGMHAQLAGVSQAIREGPLTNSVNDADFYLTVARSLLAGQQVSTKFGNDSAVAGTLTLVKQLNFVDGFDLFGARRMFDFSQFTVRGHYQRSERLARYFQAFMWTARADFRMLAAQPDAQSLRELGTAIVLCQMLQSSGQAEQWRQLDDLIRLFVGRTEAMTFAQLEPLLEAGEMTSLEAVNSTDKLATLHQQIVAGQLGVSSIMADAYFSPFGPEQVQLPRAFVLTGQRFNPDGWALGEMIFDRVQWNEEIPGYSWFGKVIRRYGSALDVAYTALGNRQVGWEIAQRMLDTASRNQFRDGLPYAHNLVAVARTFDRVSPVAWQDSIYTRWLGALRELSHPTTAAYYPEVMRTRAWALHTLNTQLASYTELKHDTVLYAAQPYAAMITCEYPTGFVEPAPAFWLRMQDMAQAAATNLARLPASGSITVPPPFGPIVVDLATRQAARVAFCNSFAANMAMLAGLASKELLQQPFTDAEITWVRGLMNRQDRPYFGPTYDGWYPSLFYTDYGQALFPSSATADSNGSNRFDPLVTDVQTAPPDEVDPIGGVLHEGTGNPDLLMIAVDNGPDRMVYAGPVTSHYEFILPGPVLKRLTDSEWSTAFPSGWGARTGTPPPRPDWTRSYLAPR